MRFQSLLRPAIRSAAGAVIDALENRQLLSAVVDGATLRIDSGSNGDTINVVFYEQEARVTENGVERTLDISNVTRVRAFLGSGNDTLTVVQAEEAFSRPVTVYGGPGDDRIRGGGSRDLIYGENGKDTLDGAGQRDVIHGGDGDDFIDGSGERDNLFGDAGNDTLSGGDGADTLYGNAGDDDVNGNADDDRVFGGDGISSGAGDDTLSGNNGNDTLFGGIGSDVVSGGAGDDQIISNDALDTDRDSLYGDAGDDSLDAGGLNAFLDGGSGNDYLRGTVGDDTLAGGADNDTLNGNAGVDVVNGGDGDDEIDGGQDVAPDNITLIPDDDTITGGAGRDLYTSTDFEVGDVIDYVGTEDVNPRLSVVLTPSLNRLRIDGGAANDRVRIQLDPTDDAFFQVISSESTTPDVVTTARFPVEELGYLEVSLNGGKDTLEVVGVTFAGPKPSSGYDATIYTGSGDDVVRFDASADRVQFFGGGGDDVFDSNPNRGGVKILYAGPGDDTLRGGKSSDLLEGESGNDVLEGFGGADNLQGGDGADVLDGGKGARSRDGVDLLVGGSGRDTLAGYNGIDRIYGLYEDDNAPADPQPDVFDLLEVDSREVRDFVDGVDIAV